MTTIGIIAPSSAVPGVELDLGIETLKAHGFNVKRHPQCDAQHFTFAGTDQQRADALFEYAHLPGVDVLWTARGGYGATRLLPLLDELTHKHGKPPRKLLAGYSDITALLQYVRHRWGWSVLHANVPASLSFNRMKEDEWQATIGCIRGERPGFPWETIQLEWINTPPHDDIPGVMLGGNIAVWQYVSGTPWQPAEPCIMFFEELNEQLYRIDAMINHIEQLGGFAMTKAIVLGDFKNCDDDPSDGLVAKPTADELHAILDDEVKPKRKAIRKAYNLREGLNEIFAARFERLNIPVALGMPVGHGPNYSPLPIGATYRLTTDGHLSLEKWDWFEK